MTAVMFYGFLLSPCPSCITQHAYLSEHVITADLKKAMRKAIRDNRVKHTRHKTASNFDVIRRCTNMW